MSKIRNIGPASMRWLEEIGVETLEELRRVGSVPVYAMVRDQHPEATLNLLWSLEAALRDMDWHELSQEVKDALIAELQAVHPD